MFTLTDSAGAHLAMLLRSKEAPDDTAVRIAPGRRGLTILVDEIREEDHGYEYGDRVVLVLTEDVRKRLSDKILSCDHTDDGPHLVLQSKRTAAKAAKRHLGRE
jgi:hypothetical protein